MFSIVCLFEFLFYNLKLYQQGIDMAAQFDNNTSFTRSLYIGKDKSAEVMKRREAVEKELMAKREAKMREQEERMEHAKQQKDLEIRERIRQRQQKELERQKAAMDRRIAQLEEINAKKEEILHRNHQKASRTAHAQQSQKKLVYAFGSSTPRELSFLEKLNQQRSTSRATSPIMTQQPKTEQGISTKRLPSRFMLSGHTTTTAPASAMSRSVFGTLTNAAPSFSGMKKKQLTSVKSPPKREGRQTETSPASSLHTASMTQSLYIGKPTIAKPNGPKTLASRSSPKTKENNIQVANKEDKNLTRQQNAKPIIRPRKVIEQNTQNPIDEGLIAGAGTSTALKIDSVKQEEVNFISRQQQEQQIEGNILPETFIQEYHQAETLVDKIIENATNAEGQQENLDLSDQSQNETYPEAFTDAIPKEYDQLQMNDMGQNTANELHLLDETAETLVQQEEERNSSFENSTNSGDRTLVMVEGQQQNQLENTSPEIVEVKLDNNGSTNPSKSISPTPAAIIVPPEHEEIREARRQRLNEILQRTRQENTASGPAGLPKANGTGTIGNVISSTNAMTAVANPLITNIDKTALAKELLAQRRLQKLQQQQQEPPTVVIEHEWDQHQQRPKALADELADSGFFVNGDQKNNPMPVHYQLPGQIITPQQEYTSPFPADGTTHPLTGSSYQKGNECNTNGHDMDVTQRTPPEDPHMNEREREVHPPEPNLIDLS